MKTDRKDSQVQITLDGAIGETTPFFTMPLTGVTELIVDLARVTYINSIGVKQWVVWTGKLPKDCKVKLLNCPFVIVSQAATVVGFMTPNMTFESIRMPYSCDSCNHEDTVLATRGNDFFYSSRIAPKSFKVAEHLPCPKCRKPTLEPDFLVERAFTFLT